MKRYYAKAIEIANDYIDNNLYLEALYKINDEYSVTLFGSVDNQGCIGIELLRNDESEDGVVITDSEILYETKEISRNVLANAITELMDLISDEANMDLVTEYSLDVNFSIYKGKVTIGVRDIESGEIKIWNPVNLDTETLSRVCGQVGDDIMSWIELRAEEIDETRGC